jgi:ATP-binding cassette subfamily G (WHITE) protein 2 (PDR)
MRPWISETVVTQTMTAMGIVHVGDTNVGNDLIRGVSGGQKKRVTVAEASLARPVIR